MSQHYVIHARPGNPAFIDGPYPHKQAAKEAADSLANAGPVTALIFLIEEAHDAEKETTETDPQETSTTE